MRLIIDGYCNLFFSVPKDSSYSEMICVGCVKKNPFLAAYAGLAVNVVTKDKDAKRSFSIGII